MKELIKAELMRYMMFFKEEYNLPSESFNDNDGDYLAGKIVGKLEESKCQTMMSS